jgi:hypothetical protein
MALPGDMPTIVTPTVELRPFCSDDRALVQEASLDPHIPLITSVPSTSGPEEAMAFIDQASDTGSSPPRGSRGSQVRYCGQSVPGGWAWTRSIDWSCTSNRGMKDPGGPLNGLAISVKASCEIGSGSAGGGGTSTCTHSWKLVRTSHATGEGDP